jgi:hypothetical protein
MRRRTLAIASALAVGAGVLIPTTAASAATTVTGVVTAGGAPVAGVDVSWFRPGEKNWTTVTTDASGAYSIETPDGAGQFYLAANLSWNAEAAKMRTDLDQYAGVFYGATARDYAFQKIEPFVGNSVPARVDMSLDAKARVVLPGKPRFDGQTVELQRADGSVVATGTGSETSDVAFSVVPGVYYLKLGGTDEFLPRLTNPIAVAAGQTEARKPSLTKTGIVSGTVMNTKKKVVKNSKVIVKGGGVEYRGKTDSKGRYYIEGVPAGSYKVLFGAKAKANSHYLDKKYSSVAVTSGKTTTRDATIKRGAELRISRPAGTPAGVALRAVFVGPSGNLKASAELGTANSGTAYGLSTNTHTMYLLGYSDDPTTATVYDVLQPNYGVRSVKTTAVTESSIAGPSLSTPALTVSGTVSGAPGTADPNATNPTESVLVQSEALSASTSIGADGSYSVGGLIPGTYTVTTTVKGHAPSVTPVTVKSSTAVGLAAGAPSVYSRATGAVNVDAAVDAPVVAGRIAYGEDSFLPVSDGKIDRFVAPGTLTLGRLTASSEFQDASPFYLAQKAGAPAFTVASDAPVDLGTLAYEVRG